MMQTDQPTPAELRLEVADDIDDAALARVMRSVPLGAAVLAGSAVALLVARISSSTSLCSSRVERWDDMTETRPRCKSAGFADRIAVGVRRRNFHRRDLKRDLVHGAYNKRQPA